MSETESNPNPQSPFKGIHREPYFWIGLVFALGGFLAEEISGGGPAFESFMLFGGLFLGISFERNRKPRK
jgi:hypothetical protein